MSKLAKNSTKKPSSKLKRSGGAATKPLRPANDHADAGKKNDAPSKQARVIALLRSAAGTTITAMMQETGWPQHSVRGFLAGVIRKKLKLKLDSNKINGTRVYHIKSEGASKVNEPQSARRST
jgi:hypothetical protein